MAADAKPRDLEDDSLPDDGDPGDDAGLSPAFDAQDEIEAYDKQTDRFNALAEFVMPLIPYAIQDESGFLAGGTVNDPAKEIGDDDLISARNLAMIAAFQAMRRIADNT